MVDGGPRLEGSDGGGGPRPPDLKASEEPEWCPAKRVKHTKGGDALRAPTSSRAICEASKAAEGASQRASRGETLSKIGRARDGTGASSAGGREGGTERASGASGASKRAGGAPELRREVEKWRE